jgi:hypothetical protein
MPTTPSYRQWDLFWSIVLTEQFRADYNGDHGSLNCGSLQMLDEFRDFFARIVCVGNADAESAPVPVVLHKMWCRVAAHFITGHDEFADEISGISDEEFEHITPVIEAINAELMGLLPDELINMVRSVLSQVRFSPN